MNEQIIFYGAGKNAELNLDKWRQRGIIPLCFVDADKSKHRTQFVGYDILSLEEAIAQYPEYVMYITMINKNLLAATEYLIEKGVPQDRICYFDDVERRKGCWQMEGHIHVTPDLTPCTHWHFNKRHSIPLSGDWENDFREYISFINNQRDQLRRGEECVCGDCPELTDGLWPVAFSPRLLALSDNIKGERCNCRCIYCDLSKSNDTVRDGEFTVIDILNGLEPFFPSNTQVYYAPAELTVSPYKGEVYEFMRKHGWSFSVVKTNGILFDEELARFFNTTSPTRINVSLDSGTRETYKTVKCVDCFDKVIDNLHRYKHVGAKIELKYIILDDINDNTNDIDAFAIIAKALSAQTIVTVDMNTLKTGLSDRTFAMIEYFIHTMRSHGLSIRLHSEHLRNEDYMRIKQIIGSI